MLNIEAIIIDGVRYDKVKGKTEYVCDDCELREACKGEVDFAIACGDALSSNDECWKRKE